MSVTSTVAAANGRTDPVGTPDLSVFAGPRSALNSTRTPGDAPSQPAPFVGGRCGVDG